MANQESKNKKVDLNEVLAGIQAAGKKTFKSSEGETYSAIYSATLDGWAMALLAATKDAQSHEVTAKALQAAKDEVSMLEKAVEKKKLKIQELKDLAANADKAAKDQRSKMQKEIAEANSKLQSAKDRFAEANAAKVDTAKALADAEKRLKSPEAKFVPEEALALRSEIANLKSDLELANSAMATEKVNQKTLNVQIDLLRKEAASKDKELDEANANLANFKRQLAAAQANNFDEFDADTLDMDALTLQFGDRGIAKLRKVLEIPAYDVRGRVQKLTGFFSVIGQTVSKTFRAMVDILDHAFSLLKNKSTSWISVLFPWVNGLLKDIVLMELKSASHYRLELTKIVQAVKARLPEDPLVKKTEAAQEAKTDKRDWTQRVKETRSRVTKAQEKFDKKVKDFKTRCAKFIKGSSKRIAVLYSDAKTFAGVTFGLARLGAKSAWKSFKNMFASAPVEKPTPEEFQPLEKEEYDHTSKKWRSYDYDMDTKTWVLSEKTEITMQDLDPTPET